MKTGVVLVTYNRLEKLKIALERYDKQIYLPEYIIIVNNNSNDGTYEYIEDWKKEKKTYKKHVINLTQNIGGSGGFYEGIKYALTLNCEWIWVSDDDAFLELNALRNAKDFIDKHQKLSKECSAICGQVINNKKTDYAHRRTVNRKIFKLIEKNSTREDYLKEYFEIDLFSYVGTMINKEAINKVGLPIKDFFIFYDDTEHSYRLSKVGKIICVPTIKIEHDAENSNQLSWKTYYSIRNKMVFHKRHFPHRFYFISYIKKSGKEYIKIFIKFLLRKNTKANKLIIQGLKDGKKEQLGLNKTYKPGWKIG